MNTNIDPRVERGLERHYRAFGRRVADGALRLGHKVAFNAPAAQKLLGIEGSLVAGLTRDTLVAGGARVAVGEMTKPVLEAEVAVRLGADLAASAPPDEIAAAVHGIAPAIELVDMNLPLDQLEDILAEGVFHRAVAFGTFAPPPAGAALAGLSVEVSSDGERVFEGDAEAATGVLTDVVGNIGRLLACSAEQLRAGDHLILGSMAAPVLAAPGGRFAVSLGGYGGVELTFE